MDFSKITNKSQKKKKQILDFLTLLNNINPIEQIAFLRQMGIDFTEKLTRLQLLENIEIAALKFSSYNWLKRRDILLTLRELEVKGGAPDESNSEDK